MKIGFDVSSMHGYGGVNRYSMEIILNLIKHHPEHRVVLFSSFSRARLNRLRRIFAGPSTVFEPVLPNPLALGGGLRKLVSAIRGAVLEYRSRDMDVLHITRPFADKVRAGNLVLTVHDLFPLILQEYRGEEAEREFRSNASFMLENASGIIVHSRCVAEQIENMFPDSLEKVEVVPLAVSDSFRPADKPPVSIGGSGTGKNGYYLYVGSAYPRKNLNRVLEAYRGLSDSVRADQRIVLVLTGVSRHVSAIIESRNDLSSRDGVILLEGLLEEELVRLYSSATALVFPSLAEGFGLPVLEAMACGCPVITSDCSSLPEAAGGAGLLVDPLSTDSIRGAMEQVARDNDTRKRLSSAGIARARDFSWRKTVDSNIRVYSGILD